MSYFSQADFQEAEKRGDLVVSDRLDFGPISIDIRINRLMQVQYVQGDTSDAMSLTNDQFIEKYTKDVPLVNGEWQVAPYTWLLWEPVESFEMAPGIMGDIVSRSSWARLGLRTCAKDTDHFIMKRPDIQRNIKPLCSLVSTGPIVKIKQGDEIAQMFAMTNPCPLTVEQVQELVETGEFVVKKEGRQLKVDEITWHGGMVLTMAPDIQIYNAANVLDSRNPKDDDFTPRTLSAVDRTVMPKRAFFLSTSEQYLEVPAGYIAEVSEGLSIATAGAYTRTFDPQFHPLPFRSHANAPYVGPSKMFKGKVVFENSMVWEDVILPGRKQCELFLHPLHTPYDGDTQCRYYDQTEVKR